MLYFFKKQVFQTKDVFNLIRINFNKLTNLTSRKHVKREFNAVMICNEVEQFNASIVIYQDQSLLETNTTEQNYIIHIWYSM